MSVLDSFRLDGRLALVTGCSRGIGLAMAEALAEAGADVIGVSARLDPTDSAVGRGVTAQGRRFAGYACDFAQRSALDSLVRRLEAEQPPIDILVNNAGTIRRRPAAEHPDDYWDEVLEVNLSAPFRLTRALGRGCWSAAGGT